MVPGGEPETTAIDTEIIRFSAQSKPKVLFIPTASEDNQEYCEAFARQYAENLGCSVDILRLFSDARDLTDFRKRIMRSDIVYVGGGNTLRMMKFWRQLGIDQMLNDARQQGAVLCGTSAGAICWFRQGNSDSRKFADNENTSLIKVAGLNYVDLLLCPHYDAEAHRQPALKQMMKKTRGVSIALENNCAIQIHDNDYRIIASQPDKRAFLIYWKRDEYIKQALQPSEHFQPLDSLLIR